MNWYKKAQQRLPFFSNCVSWPRELMPALNYIVDYGTKFDGDQKEAFQEFCNRTGLNIHAPVDSTNFEEYEENMSEDEWDIAGALFVFETLDWHVSYEELPGFDVVLYVHSGIEHVFATYETIMDVNERAEEEGY